MRYLVRLVTPPGGTVLEPFAGSGTTLVAAILEGFDAIGCELTADYLPIIEGRIAWAQQERAKANDSLFGDAA
jgi:site-specific DNA-methyltransferase (adenine-specific)